MLLKPSVWTKSLLDPGVGVPRAKLSLTSVVQDQDGDERGSPVTAVAL